MICIRANKDVTKTYNVDTVILNTLVNIYFSSISPKNNRKYDIHLNIINTDECEYLCKFEKAKNKYFIHMSDSIKSTDLFLYYFLHEFRHFIQHKGFKISFNKAMYDETTKLSYYQSPVEKDVSKFLRKEKIRFKRMYYKLLDMKNKITENELCMKFNGL